MSEKNLLIGIAIIGVLGLVYYKRVYRYQKMKKDALKGTEIENKEEL